MKSEHFGNGQNVESSTYIYQPAGVSQTTRLILEGLRTDCLGHVSFCSKLHTR